MNVVPLRQESLEIWFGTLKEANFQRWFVEYCGPEGAMIVGDFATEADAATEAGGWGMPVVRIRDRS